MILLVLYIFRQIILSDKILLNCVIDFQLGSNNCNNLIFIGFKVVIKDKFDLQSYRGFERIL